MVPRPDVVPLPMARNQLSLATYDRLGPATRDYQPMVLTIFIWQRATGFARPIAGR
jgi:hypothetical protein